MAVLTRKTGTNNHDFYRSEVEIRQDSILQCRHGNNLDLAVTDEAAALFKEQRGAITGLKETLTTEQGTQFNKFGTKSL
eukprot:15337529-Ditylum_brightwellii.AAC.1